MARIWSLTVVSMAWAPLMVSRASATVFSRSAPARILSARAVSRSRLPEAASTRVRMLVISLPLINSSRALVVVINWLEMPLVSISLNFFTTSLMPAISLLNLGGTGRDDRIFRREVDLGRKVRLPGFVEVQFHEHDAGDPRGFELGHIIFLQVFLHVDLHDHADEAVVGGHPDSFPPGPHQRPGT